MALVEARIADDRAARSRSVAVVALALVVALLFTYFVARTTISRLRQGVEAVGRMADGDHTAAIDANPGRDEIGRLLQALRTTRDRMSKVLAGVQASAETVATAAREINEGTHDLAGRTEQAAKLRELTSIFRIRGEYASADDLPATATSRQPPARAAVASAPKSAAAAPLPAPRQAARGGEDWARF